MTKINTFPSDFYQYLQDHTLVGIKGGTDRETFLDIWMVEVDKRIFARSWNKSNRSWFTAYLKKYTQPQNLVYAKGITQPEYIHYTMEFFCKKV